MSHNTTTALARTESPMLRIWTGLGALLLGLALLAGTTRAADMPDSFADLVEPLSPAVVNISTVQEVQQQRRMPFPPGSPFREFFDEFFDQQNPGGGDDEGQTRRLQSLGSGFFIESSGVIVTNEHVIREADEITVRTVDGDEYKAELVGKDAELDIAVLRVENESGFPAVEWGDSDTARVGDWIVTIGNPFGLGGTVTAGIVSARHRDNITSGPYDDFIQTDASINRGNSGGPMFNLDGKVIGVNSAIFSPTGGNVGIGFAIPSNQVKTVVEQILEFGRPRRGYLGVSIQPVTEMMADALGLKEARGALVASVSPDTPAAEAGLKPYDIIVEFDGREVEDNNQLVRIVGETPVGQAVDVDILRDGERMTVSLKTAERPQNLTGGGDSEESEDESGVASGLGLNLSDITPEIRQRLDIPETVNGAVVMQAAPRLRQQGLNPGDLIIEVNRSPVSNANEAHAALASLKEDGKKAALLRIFRGGNRYFLPIPLTDDEED